MKRGQRERKKLVLILIEGKSDIEALEYGLSNLYDRIDSSIEVFFLHMKTQSQEWGDITSRGGTTPQNIEKRIVHDIIDPFLKVRGVYPKDILEIVHILDIDGVYINDDLIFKKDGIEKIQYAENGMYTADPGATSERNREKRANLDLLSSIYSLKVGSKTIPYSAYYFSCNIDHFISNEENLDWVWKTTLAREFSEKCMKDDSFFQNKFLNSDDCKRGLNYQESWEYIKTGTESLKPHSNLYLHIQNLLNMIEEENLVLDGKNN